MNNEYWEFLDQLIASSTVVIDRPKNSTHPRFPEIVYPIDYGYLANTTAGDGSGIDVYVGSLPDHFLSAVILTIDLFKRDAEVKLLLGCTATEIQLALTHSNAGYMRALLVMRQDDRLGGNPS